MIKLMHKLFTLSIFDAGAMLYAPKMCKISENVVNLNPYNSPLPAAIAAPSVDAALELPKAEVASRCATSSSTKHPNPANASNKVRE